MQRVGPYLLQRQLGVGGMGAVWLGMHQETGALYAIKTLLPEADAKDHERFQREGQAQALVDDHPNVVRVHSAGSEGSIPYLVLDLATGGDLEDRLRRGPLEARDAARLVRDLARGLAHVHAAGILHRDLKPANILFDEAGIPKLVDFGLARLDQAKSLTETGALMGTPAYMAPEQALASNALTPAADVYGLGAVLYACLAGQAPFQKQTAIATLSAVISDPPPPLPSNVPRGLSRLCRKCLEKEPEARFASAAELAEALEDWLAGKAAGGGRSRVLLGLAGLVVLALLIAIPLQLSRAVDPSPSPVASPSPSLAESPSPSAWVGPGLDRLEEKLSAGRPQAEALARSWIAAHPRREREAERLRALALRGRLLGAATRTWTRTPDNTEHTARALVLPEGGVLWTEICRRLCPYDHPNQTSLFYLTKEQLKSVPKGDPARISLPGQHVTAVGPEATYWAIFDKRQTSLQRRAGGVFTLFARLPSRCHALTADSEVVVCGTEEGWIRCFDAKSRELRWERKVHGGRVSGVALLGEKVISFGFDKALPLGLSSRETGLPLSWGFDLPPLGEIRWGHSFPEHHELVLSLNQTNVVHGVRAQGSHRTYAGKEIFNPDRGTKLAGPWSPDGVTPRGVAAVGGILIFVGSQRIQGRVLSDIRLFSYESGKEVAARSLRGIDLTSVHYSAATEILATVGVRRNKTMLEVRDLAPAALR